MKSEQIRQKFLDFFKKNNHTYIKSSPIVVKDDPTLMFTNAGMNQFKDYFLGNKLADNKSVMNSQKCLRVSGKHNDLEEVGVDTYHHTMFEMLGNWSFDDYFKEGAIEMAWKFLTDELKLNKDDIYVSVFEGDDDKNINRDEESYKIWQKYVKEENILYFSSKDNFWEMGDVGPCGPCTEIHIDTRSDEEKSKIDGKTLVNNDHPQVIEIWNLVFIQFNRKKDGSFERLKSNYVDTGMGFERLSMVMQKKKSTYDTDIFEQLIRKMEDISGHKYLSENQDQEQVNISFRVIVDHIRAISFCIADGQLPSNIGSGYVIRRILRRAVRYAYQYLGMKEAFLFKLVDILAEQFKNIFEELNNQKEFIKKIIKQEEDSFYKTLEIGMRKINNLISNTNNNIISGKDSFELYDSFGFPIDLTILIARENNKQVDIQEFDKELDIQKQRSKNASKIKFGDWIVVNYDKNINYILNNEPCTISKVIKYRQIETNKGINYQLVLDNSPFYAESGGQVGDTGILDFGNEIINVIDTKRENDLIIHFTEKIVQRIDSQLEATIDISRRNSITANHSATHLLHFVLRKILGTHVEQKGSLVNDEYLRFDFTHYEKLDNKSLKHIEDEVNTLINQKIKRELHENKTVNEAKEMGAMALFGEKYGDKVRVVQFGKSIELCGGTHVENTNDIKLFKIIQETSIAAGIRRITAITSNKALELMNEKSEIYDKIHSLFSSSKNLFEDVNNLILNNKYLQKEIEKQNIEKLNLLINTINESEFEKINDIVFYNNIMNLSTIQIKDFCIKLISKYENLVVLVANNEDDKVSMNIAVSKQLIDTKGLHSGNLIKQLSHYIDGTGGGQSNYASAGGKKKEGVQLAIISLREILNNK